MSAESNARDFARRTVESMNESFEAGHERMVEKYGSGRVNPAPYIDWDDMKTMRQDYGYSWQEIAETLRERQIAQDLYESTGDTSYGRVLWDNRDESYPEAMYYYHGLFS